MCKNYCKMEERASMQQTAVCSKIQTLKTCDRQLCKEDILKSLLKSSYYPVQWPQKPTVTSATLQRKTSWQIIYFVTQQPLCFGPLIKSHSTCICYTAPEMGILRKKGNKIERQNGDDTREAQRCTCVFYIIIFVFFCDGKIFTLAASLSHYGIWACAIKGRESYPNESTKGSSNIIQAGS